MAQFFGKYRGVVTDVNDPDVLGRIRVNLPGLIGAQTSGWALPCVPGGLSKAKGSALPKIGATVWIEFEQGDPGRPVWTGCFYTSAGGVPAALRPK